MAYLVFFLFMEGSRKGFLDALPNKSSFQSSILNNLTFLSICFHRNRMVFMFILIGQPCRLVAQVPYLKFNYVLNPLLDPKFKLCTVSN